MYEAKVRRAYMKEEKIENLQLPDALSYPQPREGEQVRYWRNRRSARHSCPAARVSSTTGCQPVQSAFAYNNRSEVVSAAIGTNIFSHAYDSIGNHVLFSDNLTTNTFAHNQVNQMVGRVVLNAPSTAFAYTPDGGLSSDGTWNYSYDAEDQLTSVISTELTNGAIRVQNSYDYRHRRISKMVQKLSVTTAPPPSPPIEIYEWNTIEYSMFAYDDWNLIHETVAAIDGGTTNVSEVQYFWGLDLSDTLQGAGGVGGLLAVSSNDQFYFPTFDNNGNVTKYLDESGNVVAAYEYDDFGRVIAQSGPLADFFRHRFSTKYLDVETGFYYYGYRFYSPSLMRWLSRDPIEEQDSENLFQFCLNSPTHRIDTLGLASANQWNYTYPKNGKFFDPLIDFLDGGDSKTYRFVYQDSASQRLMEHPTIKALLDEYSRIKCGDSFQKSGNMQYTAKASDYVFDVVTSFGVKNPDGSLNEANAKAGDLGYQVLGSFSVQYDMSVNCSTCTKRLFIRVKNTFSVESFFRNPFTRRPTITTPFLKPVSMVFDYDFEDSVR